MHSNVTPTYAFILKPDFYFKVYESDTKIYTLQQAKNSPKYHCEKKGRRVIGEGEKGPKKWKKETDPRRPDSVIYLYL